MALDALGHDTAVVEETRFSQKICGRNKRDRNRRVERKCTVREGVWGKKRAKKKVSHGAEAGDIHFNAEFVISPSTTI